MKQMRKGGINGTSRMFLTIIGLLLIISCTGIFIGYEMIQNQAYYLRSCEKEIALEVDYLSQILEDKLLAKEEQEVIVWLENNGVGTGSRWQFLEKNGSICYLKNSSYTKEILQNEKGVNEILEAFKKQNRKVISVSFQQDNEYYTYGLIVDEEALLTQGSVNKHMTYVILAFSVIIIFMFCSVVLCMQVINKQLDVNQRVNKSLVETQLKVETLQRGQLEETEKKRDEAIWQEGFSQYDNDFLEALLENSNQQALMPMHILEIKLVLSSRYYSKQETQDFMENLRGHLEKSHVLLEVAKGEFVILLYQTDEEKAQLVKEKIEMFWQPLLEKEQVGVHMDLAKVDLAENAKVAYKHLKEQIAQRLVA